MTTTDLGAKNAQRPPSLRSIGRAALSFFFGVVGLILASLLSGDSVVLGLAVVFGIFLGLLFRMSRRKGADSSVDPQNDNLSRGGTRVAFELLFAWGWAFGTGCLVAFLFAASPFGDLPLVVRNVELGAVFFLIPTLLIAVAEYRKSRSRVAVALIGVVTLVVVLLIWH